MQTVSVKEAKEFVNKQIYDLEMRRVLAKSEEAKDAFSIAIGNLKDVKGYFSNVR
jgi:hypothetical protein